MDLNQKFDVIVVGAGPAGIAFAKTLITRNAKFKVLLLEKTKYPRNKICGDALTRQSLPLVEEIFPELKGEIPTENYVEKCTYCFPNNKRIVRTNRRYDVIRRKVFDAKIWSTIQNSSVTIVEEANVFDLALLHGSVVGVRFTHEQHEKTALADLVVGADGSYSIIRRLTGTTKHDKRIGGVQQYVKGIPPHNDGLVFIIDLEVMGYFWIFPFMENGERWANVGYSSQRSSPSKGFQTFCRHEITKEFLGDGEFQGQPNGFPLNLATTKFNRIILPRPLWGKEYLLLGDAACLVSPFNGEGIAAALYSGKLAAELLMSGCALNQIGPIYQKQILAYLKSSYQLLSNSIALTLLSSRLRFLRNWQIDMFNLFYSK